MRYKSVYGIALGLAFAFSGAMVTGPALAADMAKQVSPKILASNCFNCHGVNGNSVKVMDDIAELSAVKITKSMMAFKSGEKPATIMNRIAKGYSDAEIKAIAKYFEAANK